MPVELEGKIIAIEVEVIDAQLDFNILQGQSWNYTMYALVSSFF